ncbi:diguanylate cyclase domain-containing protein [Roseateles sp. DC23W]|uniref:Diguanylate cyclase domain-containing protein n=1 Tax=Pelomonas dachongensis TaxID=3299029 RepID=A0ABW7EQ86_9BURK
MSETQRLSDAAPPGHRPIPFTDILRLDSPQALGQQVSRQLLRCRRQSAPLSVIWIEAQLHARAGSDCPQATREAMMQALSRRLRNRVRGSDEVMRVGEDGFAVVLPLVGRVEAALVQARLLQALKGSYGVDGLQMHAELHLGAATFPDAGHSGTELVEHARHSCMAASTMARLVQTSSHSLRM